MRPTAGSGGDLLPWMFDKLDLGTLVGRRTWGGLVGTLGFPVLMDGGGVTAPNVAIWTEDGFIVENVGVPPDVEIEQMPVDVIAGRDPQLEKAIEIALQQLKEKSASPVQKTGFSNPRPPVEIRITLGCIFFLGGTGSKMSWRQIREFDIAEIVATGRHLARRSSLSDLSVAEQVFTLLKNI